MGLVSTRQRTLTRVVQAGNEAEVQMIRGIQGAERVTLGAIRWECRGIFQVDFPPEYRKMGDIGSPDLAQKGYTEMFIWP